jgi:glycosyltransferase involved in cell wall biosynthesis
VVIPYYNEADYLPRTLSSLLAQTLPPERMVLVDNGSTDDSAIVCRNALKAVEDIEVTHLLEVKPGKVHALQKACSVLETEFVVLCDADTYYPPHYIQLCSELFRHSPRTVVALMALPVAGDPTSLRARVHRGTLLLLSKLFRKCTFTGGYGQVFRTRTLRDSGGFSEDIWKYVLLDHEVMQRVFRYGSAVYNFDLWCIPSTRRDDRPSVRWTVAERALYFFTPWSFKDWYFYRFLGPRLERRGLSHLRLREKPWQ